MPTNSQLALGAAAVVGAYAMWNHQKNKNVVDRASDSLEQARYGARQQTGSNTMSDDAAKAYYDTKKSIQRS